MTHVVPVIRPQIADDDQTCLIGHLQSLRRSVETITFTDIEKSTMILESVGDEEFARLAAAHDHLIRCEVERCQGLVINRAGDGFMLTFPTVTHAACCMLRVRKAIAHLNTITGGPTIRVRAGIHRGVVLTNGSKTYVGLNVHLAHRISACAKGGSIAMSSEAIRELPRGAYQLGPTQWVSLKGLAGVYELATLISGPRGTSLGSRSTKI